MKEGEEPVTTFLTKMSNCPTQLIKLELLVNTLSILGHSKILVLKTFLSLSRIKIMTQSHPDVVCVQNLNLFALSSFLSFLRLEDCCRAWCSATMSLKSSRTGSVAFLASLSLP